MKKNHPKFQTLILGKVKRNLKSGNLGAYIPPTTKGCVPDLFDFKSEFEIFKQQLHSYLVYPKYHLLEPT
jgi:hypothetical protein